MKKHIGRNIIIILILLYLPCFQACKKGEPADNPEKQLRDMVELAIGGDAEANKKLNNLIDLKLPGSSQYDNFIIESFKLKSGKRFYYLVLNYRNPVYNRFAIYDSAMTNYLIDKSLNGHISVEVQDIEKSKFIRVVESFLSKDVLDVKRLSLYKADDKSASLIFRNLISLSTTDYTVSQDIIRQTADSVYTHLSIPMRFGLSDTADVFVYDSIAKKFISQHNTVDSIIRTELQAFKRDSLILPLITDKESADKFTFSK